MSFSLPQTELQLLAWLLRDQLQIRAFAEQTVIVFQHREEIREEGPEVFHVIKIDT